MISASSRRLRLIAAGLALAGYVAVAFGAEDAWPIYRFDMFSWPMRTPVGRVMAQTADGETRGVEDFERWVCDEPPLDAVLGPAPGCPDHVRGDRFERQVLRHLSAHMAATPQDMEGGTPVQLVRRVIAVTEEGRPVALACALASCTAAPVFEP